MGKGALSDYTNSILSENRNSQKGFELKKQMVTRPIPTDKKCRFVVSFGIYRICVFLHVRLYNIEINSINDNNSYSKLFL